jgi:ParB family transcriptional regulator, chromosome partitioning protein
LLRLLNLPLDVQGYIREGKLSAGHARALINTTDPSALARTIIEKGLSVRETEQLAKETSTTQPRTKKAGGSDRVEKDADTRALEADLSANLRMAVSINHEPGGERGTLTIRYNTLDDLDNLCRNLSQMDRD